MESTSTATLVFGTALSRKTDDVREPARVGAEPRITRLGFSVAERGCDAPALEL